jgi:hypothetical protein
VARSGDLLSLLMAGRLAHRLAGPWAAALAVAGLLLSTHWVREFAHGYTEPLAVGLLLAAVDRHLSNRPRQAFVLGALVALTRPEAWGVLLLYGAVQWRRRELHPLLLALVAVSVPALWLVPDWIGSGDPLHAGAVSRHVLRRGAAATFDALGQAALIPPLLLVLTAVAGVVLAFRRGERTIPWLGAIVLGWTALLTVMMLASYPVSGRFFVLPMGLLCVVGAAGAVYVVRAAPGRGALIVSALLALAAVPTVALRAENMATDGRESVRRAKFQSDLRTVVDRASVSLRSCPIPRLPVGLFWTKGAVAWELDVPFLRVRDFPTSAGAYLRSRSAGDAVPRLSSASSVTVGLRGNARRSVFLSPFGAARISVDRRRRGRLETVASAGDWRALVLAGTRACSGRKGS